MESLLQDIRYAARRLARSPGFTSVAVLSLALAIGVNTAVFTVVNAVLLTPPPFDHPEQLMLVRGLDQQMPGGDMPLSFPNYEDLRSRSTTFAEMGAWTSFGNMAASLTGAGEPERVRYALGSASLFSVLRTRPVQGRTFTPDEDQFGGGPQVALISAGLWKRRFGADPELVGRQIVLDTRPYTVVGILPPEFSFVSFPAIPDVWLPLGLDPLSQGRHFARGVEYLGVIGRLRPEATHQRALEELGMLSRQLAQDFPGFNARLGLNAVPLGDSAALPFRAALWLLLGAVSLVLLIACANVANLFLVRASGRASEIRLRLALGEGSGRLVQSLVAESALVALMGGGCGLLLGVWGVGLMARFPALGPPSWTRPYTVAVTDLHLDGTVLLFTLAVSLATVLVFGLIPAWQLRRSTLQRVNTVTSRSGAEGEARRARRVLIVAEMALALILLVGGGLLTRSLIRLASVDPGFQPDRVLVMDLGLSREKYPEPRRMTTFFDELLGRIRSLPGVQFASLVDQLPLDGPTQQTSFRREGEGPPAPGEVHSVMYTSASADYFNAMGMNVVAGRAISPDDQATAPRVAVINSAMAALYWPGQDPLGKRFTLSNEALRVGERGAFSFDWTGAAREVVGVVADVRRDALAQSPRPEVYLPYPQQPVPAVTLAIRSGSDPRLLADAVRQEVSRIDRGIPISHVRTMESVVGTSIGLPRFRAALFGIFAGLALVLSAVGVYGVMAYSVSQRSREIGIRAALGAEQDRLVRLIVLDGLRLAAPGLAIGLSVSLLASRLLSGMLYQLSPTDAPTLLSATILLALISVIASYLPAKRAAKVDPAAILRAD